MRLPKSMFQLQGHEAMAIFTGTLNPNQPLRNCGEGIARRRP